ncbi:binding-protein-dependent transport systems inner membrane component [Methanospirillum hungatei JF-1]|uniref:Binding-protein-dependent transport systems inner membrane component n=1 Tax=Methanospirillum hungatei JF-1 (strain ATCC 27890 / DSM 864 / NBRC 100397 / JF-1) TaxID=323259 RepID=Q2FPT4_METHJ|nr:ABC transporter permease [Methanospirillum hungatei]ABD39971.1 binding-protein-dependent transport systems inner membrane component [Methanospirillum hungatei JF-1]
MKVSTILCIPGIKVLIIIILIAVAVPFLLPHDPNRANLEEAEQPPSLDHWCGTDKLGRDVFTRTIYGTRISLIVGLTAAVLAVSMGAGIGITAGFIGGKVDGLLMRIVDTINSPPEVILLIVLATIFPRSILTIILIISLTHWMSTSRLIRGETLSIKERPFVEAAIALGADDRYIMKRHILPNLYSILVISVTLMAAHAIMMEAMLSFLGLGIPAHMASWGNMLNQAQSDVMRGIWWTSIFPGIMLVATVWSIYRLGEGLKEYLTPHRDFLSRI